MPSNASMGPRSEERGKSILGWAPKPPARFNGAALKRGAESASNSPLYPLVAGFNGARAQKSAERWRRFACRR